MFFSVNSTLLKNSLTKVNSVIEKKSINQLIGYTLIELEKNKITLSSTDNEVYVKVISQAESDTNASFCINTKNLFDIIKDIPDTTLKFKMENDSNTLNLESNNLFYSLLIYNSQEYPKINFPSNLNFLKTNKNELSRMIQITNHAISNDETRIYLNGLFFQEVNNKLRAVATDGHRLSLIETDTVGKEVSSNHLVNGIIVPKKGVNEIRRMTDTNSEIIQIAVDESFLFAKTSDDYILSIRLIAREYPKYQAVIPSKAGNKLVTNRSQLYEAIKRIRIMTNEKSNQVRLNISENKIELSANHPSLGKAKEIIPISYSGKSMEIGFNAKYLIDVLSILDDGNVELELGSEISPVVIRSPNIENYLGIIMPLKL